MNDNPKTAEVGSSHEEGELTPKNDMHLNNGHGTSSKLCISPNQHSYSDDSDKSRIAIPNSKSRLNNSHRSSSNMSPEKVSRSPRFRSDSRNPVRKSGELGQGRSSRNPLVSLPGHLLNEPHGSTHYGGRNIDGRNRDRLSSYRSYSERSPPRRYRSPPRGRSPLSILPIWQGWRRLK
ncbi:hypothetical protein OIU84_013613 [Salix udensis]|uniref:Uncharacterized protein n=1 Tax=Salix udensis TaxID=889485 RepID=A0AAD6NUX6_9ROSI|nr:hypothetical protein OIU84_013613 [Salix udensis]